MTERLKVVQDAMLAYRAWENAPRYTAGANGVHAACGTPADSACRLANHPCRL
jgi:hypothetical protein